MSALTADVRDAALFPALDLPEPPPGHPYTVIRRDGYSAGFFPGMSHANVSIRRVSGQIAARVAEVRALLTEHGFRRAAWIVADAAEPRGLAALLQEQGLELWDENEGGLERCFRQMALTAAPPGAPDGVRAHPIGTFDDFVAAARIANDAFELSEQDRKVFDEQQEALWAWEERFPGFRTFVAVAEGEVIGSASAIFGRNAVYLVGGSVRADRRGRGGYRALVRARWDAAEAGGTPALTVTAGAMSGPVLDRLGFVTVGEGVVLSDRF